MVDAAEVVANAADDAPPLRFEKVDGRLLVTVDGPTWCDERSRRLLSTAAVGVRFCGEMGHLLHSDSPLMTYIVNPTARSNSLKPRTLFTGQTISSVFKCCKLAILFYSSHLLHYHIHTTSDSDWAVVTTACKLECYENNRRPTDQSCPLHKVR